MGEGRVAIAHPGGQTHPTTSMASSETSSMQASGLFAIPKTSHGVTLSEYTLLVKTFF